MSLPKGIITKPLTSQDIRKAPFVLFQAHHDDYYQMAQDSLRGLQQESLLAKIFFHPKNVDLIQKQIIIQVFRRSNGEYMIEKQDETTLQIVMRSIFLQHAKHLPNHIKEQITELDNMVVDAVVPDILSEIKAHFTYLKTVFSPREIMDHPVNVSNAGKKTLPSISQFFDPNPH
jgi:hypothetical protein